MAQNLIPDNAIDPNLLASYEAMYPALTNIINGQRSISKMGGPVYKNIDGGGGGGFQNPVGEGNVGVGGGALPISAIEVGNGFYATKDALDYGNRPRSIDPPVSTSVGGEASAADGPVEEIGTAVRPGGITWDREDKATTGTFDPPMISGVGTTVTPGGTTRTVDRRDYAVNRDAPNPAVNDLRDAGAITEGLDDNTKVELANVTAEANKLLTSKGWSDSGNWGYARTRNMLTGGGLGPVVTEGAMVPWKSQGQDASSADYISNVGGGDIFPSRLSEADRLKSGGGVLSFVPEGQREGWQNPIDISGTGSAPIADVGINLVNVYNNLPDNVKADLPSVKEADVTRAQTYVNTLRNSNITKDTFKDDKTVDDVGNTLGGFLGVADSKLTEGLKAITGLTDEDVAGKNFYEIMNTNLPFFETEGGSGITPLDIIMLASGGLAALPLVAVNKFGLSMLAPIKNAVEGGIKSIFSFVLGKTDKLFNTKGGELSPEDINASDLADLSEQLGVDKPVGMIDKGSYYDPSGKLVANNMRKLSYGFNTTGGANAFKDTLNNIAISSDSKYTAVYYNTETGRVDIEHADGTITENAGYVTISGNDIHQGTPTGKTKKRSQGKDMSRFDPKSWFMLDQSTFDQLAGVNPDAITSAEETMNDILRAWEEARKAIP